MAIFAMSDLHLSLSADKPMDVFGSLWHNYMDRIYENWQESISPGDLVIIGGDISWAMYLEQAKDDFCFLNSLNGHKLLVRGNHDFWWSSYAKLKAFAKDNGFDTISFLQNDAFLWQDAVISGTRGWLIPGDSSFSASDAKIYEREIIRLKLSLLSAQSKKKENPAVTRHIAALHYPPVLPDGTLDTGISTLLKYFGVTECIYGHLHGPSCAHGFSGTIDDVRYALTSCDHLSFTPYKLD